MPFEVFGANFAQIEGRDAFIEIYAFFRQTEVDLPDELNLEGRLVDWVNTEPDDAKEFLKACSEHEEPELRLLAVRCADDYAEKDPEFALGIIEKVLSDTDPEVRRRASGWYRDMLRGDDVDDLFKFMGLIGVARIIRAYKTAKESS